MQITKTDIDTGIIAEPMRQRTAPRLEGSTVIVGCVTTILCQER